jgi:hypothetical protein
MEGVNICPQCQRGTLRPVGNYTWSDSKGFSTGPKTSASPPVTVRVVACDQCSYIQLYKEPS